MLTKMSQNIRNAYTAMTIPFVRVDYPPFQTGAKLLYEATGAVLRRSVGNLKEKAAPLFSGKNMMNGNVASNTINYYFKVLEAKIKPQCPDGKGSKKSPSGPRHPCPSNPSGDGTNNRPDPCAPKSKPSKPKSDPCKPKKKKSDPCAPKSKPSKPKSDPCKPKKKPKKDPCSPS